MIVNILFNLRRKWHIFGILMLLSIASIWFGHWIVFVTCAQMLIIFITLLYAYDLFIALVESPGQIV